MLQADRRYSVKLSLWHWQSSEAIVRCLLVCLT